MKEIQNDNVVEKTIVCEKHGPYTSDSVVVGPRSFDKPCPKCIEERSSEESVDKEKSERERALASFRKNVSLSGIPNILQGAKIESFIPTSEENSQNVLSGIKKYNAGFCIKKPISSDKRWFPAQQGAKSILMIGSSGTGKTHLACCLAQELLFEGKVKSIKYVTTYDLLGEIKSTWRRDSVETEKQVVDRYVGYDFLIIDEVGVQFGSDVETLLFFNLYNKRLCCEKATCLISNLNPVELENVVGPRAVDRMRMGEYFVFDWKSYRAGNR